MKTSKMLLPLFCGLIACPLLTMAQGPGAGQGPGQMSNPSQQGRPSISDPNRMGNPDDSKMSSKVDDKSFVKDAAVGGLTEVQLGKLAQEKGSAEAIKQFGQRMVDDHTKANERLKSVAAEAKLSVPDSIDSKNQARIDKLSKLNGPQFDRAYINDQLKDHEEDVRKFQAESQGGSNPQVKQFATENLPTLQDHLAMVKDLKKSKGSSMTSSVSSKTDSSR